MAYRLIITFEICANVNIFFSFLIRIHSFCLEDKTDIDDNIENLESTDEEESDEESKASPNETEFTQGQVYYSSLGKQVHVYPENVSGDVEVTLI